MLIEQKFKIGQKVCCNGNGLEVYEITDLAKGCAFLVTTRYDGVDAGWEKLSQLTLVVDEFSAPLEKAIERVTKLREEYRAKHVRQEELLVQHGGQLSSGMLKDTVINLLVCHQVDAMLVRALLAMHECKEESEK